MDDFDDIQCEDYYGDEPDVDTWTEYQDLPWGGDEDF